MRFFVITLFLASSFLGIIAEVADDMDICSIMADRLMVSPDMGFNLTSPNYSQPMSYRAGVETDGLTCEVYIQADEDGFLAISIKDMHLGGPKDTPDSVRITRVMGDKTVIHMTGTSKHPKTVTVKATNITIKFQANEKKEPPAPATQSPEVPPGGDRSSDDEGGDGEDDSLALSNDESDGDPDGNIFSASYSYSFRKRRKRRDVTTSGPRGFKLEISWVPKTGDVTCSEYDFTCHARNVAEICVPGSHQCDDAYTCPDRSDEYDCDTCDGEDLQLLNGEVLPALGPFYIGQLLFFSCNKGYDMIGAREIQCTLQRTWSDLFPICVLIPESTIDPKIIAREKRETTIFLSATLTSIAVLLAIAIGLLQLCSKHLEKQEKIYEAEWEAEQAEKEAAEAAEAAANSEGGEGDPNGNIATIKIPMEDGDVPDPTEVKVSLNNSADDIGDANGNANANQSV